MPPAVENAGEVKVGLEERRRAANESRELEAEENSMGDLEPRSLHISSRKPGEER